MIFLEPTTNQILMEEGQVVLSLQDLNITWKMLEKLFKGTFNQCKGYITVYDWTTEVVGLEGKFEEDWTHVKHMTYNAYNNMQRFMPDIPGNLWEFNPFTKKMTTLFSSNFSFEVGKYPLLDNLPLTLYLDNVKAGVAYSISLPCTPDLSSFSIVDTETGEEFNPTISAATTTKKDTCVCCQVETNEIATLTGNPSGSLDFDDLSGSLTFSEDHTRIAINMVSKYVAIAQLDLTCELFYNWYKANVLTMIGAIKKQTDMSGSGLPFDINSDDLLSRAHQIMDRVEELKGTKQNWSNF